MIEFAPFPKLARLSRECVVTEKLDGTNAQIVIQDLEGPVAPWPQVTVAVVGRFGIAAGSRSRYITPGKTSDNYGFAAWVRDNAEELVKLGEGRHFGEWWGKGIQRGYGLDERRFSLFNPFIENPPSCVSLVPALFAGPFDTQNIDNAMYNLGVEGSHAAPGFMNPEGIVVYHTHARVAFKKTFDDKHKEAA